MSRENQFESQESPEVTKEDVIDAFKKGGSNDREAIRHLHRWLEQKEVETDMEQGPLPRIKRDMELSEIYEAMGNGEYALELLRDSANLALQNDYFDLIIEIKDRMAKF